MKRLRNSNPPAFASADVLIVGAGIVGLAHAVEARRRGLTVVMCDREQRAVGASVRNFGHVFTAAMAGGRALECALRARERWIELGAAASFDVVQAGSVIAARAEDELAVMQHVAAQPQRAGRMLTAAEVADLAGIPPDGLIGGLHTANDVRVDPRTAVAAIAQWLSQDPGIEFHWGTTVHEIDLPRVSTSAGLISADRAVVCPGPDFSALFGDVFEEYEGLTRAKLQMLSVAAPGGWRCEPALLTGLSLLHYPGFSEAPVADALRERLERERPELIAAGIHLIVAQRPNGDLIIGDTHEYDLAVSPFGDERLDDLLLAEARTLLGVRELRVLERWHGIYPKAPGDPFMIASPAKGVRVVEIVSGVGMTTALGLAPLVLDTL